MWTKMGQDWINRIKQWGEWGHFPTYPLAYSMPARSGDKMAQNQFLAEPSVSAGLNSAVFLISFVLNC